LLSRIQNTRGISYCGSYTNYGFHEDGFSSGLKIAQEHLGARIPFKYQDSALSGRKGPVLGLRDLLLRLLILVIHFLILFLERAWSLLVDVQRDVKVGTKQVRFKGQKLNGVHR
jgi:hypothetical protein